MMDIREIHHKFFGFRNGVVAKAFLDAGAPYKRIFGLQLPQIGEIARETGKDDALAEALWEESDCREARLLSCYLFNPENLAMDKALALAREVKTREEADILTWRLLRNLPYAHELLERLDGYTAEALARNLEA